MSALQRLDSGIQQLLHTAKHTVLYKLDQQQAWSKQDVEGPMFIVQRSSEPRYRLLILNRRAADNYSVALDSDMKLERTQQYLFYTAHEAHEDGVYNLWFYEEEDCVAALDVLSSLVASLRAVPSSANAPPPAATQASHTDHHPAPSDAQSMTASAPRLSVPASVPRNIEYQQAIDQGGQRALHQQLSSFLTKFQQTDDAHLAAEQERRHHDQRFQPQPQPQSSSLSLPSQPLHSADSSQQRPDNHATTAKLHGLLERMNIRTTPSASSGPSASSTSSASSHLPQQGQPLHSAAHNSNAMYMQPQTQQYHSQPAQTPPSNTDSSVTASKQLSKDQFRVVLSKLVHDEKWLNYMFKKYQQHNYDLKAMFK